jgi:acyl-CoA reductase-like NAD-dependent aldehyde dehydrogenase
MRYSPGDLSITLPVLPDGDPAAAVDAAETAFEHWRWTSVDQRIAALRVAAKQVAHHQNELATGITLETGKPITEAKAEIGFVVAKFELAIADAKRYLPDSSEPDNARPNVIRRRPRGVAAVIGPFNFPIHLAHGAIVAYLLAGNTVIFKPSPFAAGVCHEYGRLMAGALPPGVFQVVQGGADIGEALVQDNRVRSVCFTGSVAAGRAIARACADDVSKDVALELGGKNAAIVCRDANLDSAAMAVADAMCATAGQRCNSTSRVLVDADIEGEFSERLKAAVAAYIPGDPLLPTTRLGPLISSAARNRFLKAMQPDGNEVNFLLRGEDIDAVDGKRGHYVTPSIVRLKDHEEAARTSLAREELFGPLLVMVPVTSVDNAISVANDTPFGLTASVFTADVERFNWFADRLNAGNIYHNLPTTLSPGTLPFGGWGDSGNGRPGGRGFIRVATNEQVIQRAE